VETLRHFGGALCLLILFIEFGKGIYNLLKDNSLAYDDNFRGFMAVLAGILYLVTASLSIK